LGILGFDEKFVDLSTVFEVLGGENFHDWVAVDPVVTQELTALESASIRRGYSRRLDYGKLTIVVDDTV